jgi:hypothetical protein
MKEPSKLKMDIVKALRELYKEKRRLDASIATLEGRLKSAHNGSSAKSTQRRRGRKSMSSAERLEVSKRMTLYWEARRAQLRPPPDQQASSTSAPSTAS